MKEKMKKIYFIIVVAICPAMSTNPYLSEAHKSWIYDDQSAATAKDETWQVYQAQLLENEQPELNRLIQLEIELQNKAAGANPYLANSHNSWIYDDQRAKIATDKAWQVYQAQLLAKEQANAKALADEKEQAELNLLTQIENDRDMAHYEAVQKARNNS